MRTSPPFRADHVGSLLRPPRLLQARARPRRRAASTPTSCAAIEDDAIRDVVRMQEDVGLQSATDGEFRRASWHMDFIYQLDGVDRAPGNLKVQFRNDEGTIEFTPAALHVDGASRRQRDDLRRRLRVPAVGRRRRPTPKLTIPSPSMVHYRGGRAAIDAAVYPDLDALLGRPHGRLRGAGARGSASSAARTCSSTTRASPTSTIRAARA